MKHYNSSLQIDGEQHQALTRLCLRRGVPTVTGAARLVNWLISQDELIQSSVLDQMDREWLAVLAQQELDRRNGNGRL